MHDIDTTSTVRICEYDDVNHEYRIDGLVVPSVTQIVSIYGNDLAEDDDLELTIEAAAERGTILHGYLAHRLRGLPPSEYEMPDEYREYKDACEMFLAEHEILPILIEQPLYAGTYAGTPDLVAVFDGKEAILDYKFVSQIAKTKVGAQLAGYKMLCEYDALVFPELMFAVQFGRDGYRLYPCDDMEEDFFVALSVYERKHRPHRRGQIGYKEEKK